MSSSRISFVPNQGTISTVQYINVYITNYEKIKKLTFTIQIDTTVANLSDIVTDPTMQGSIQFTKSNKQIFVTVYFDRIDTKPENNTLKLLSFSIKPEQKGQLKILVPRDSLSAIGKDNGRVFITAEKATFEVSGDTVFHETITQRPTFTTTATPTYQAVITTPTPPRTTKKKTSSVNSTILILNFLIISVIILLIMLVKKINTSANKSTNNLLQENTNEQEIQSQSNT